jgi:hypothetical protein
VTVRGTPLAEAVVELDDVRHNDNLDGEEPVGEVKIKKS